MSSSPPLQGIGYLLEGLHRALGLGVHLTNPGPPEDREHRRDHCPECGHDERGPSFVHDVGQRPPQGDGQEERHHVAGEARGTEHPRGLPRGGDLLLDLGLGQVELLPHQGRQVGGHLADELADGPPGDLRAVGTDRLARAGVTEAHRFPPREVLEYSGSSVSAYSSRSVAVPTGVVTGADVRSTSGPPELAGTPYAATGDRSSIAVLSSPDRAASTAPRVSRPATTPAATAPRRKAPGRRRATPRSSSTSSPGLRVSSQPAASCTRAAACWARSVAIPLCPPAPLAIACSSAARSRRLAVALSFCTRLCSSTCCPACAVRSLTCRRPSASTCLPSSAAVPTTCLPDSCASWAT